ncbi:osteopontin [Esox lucius]|uniref:osteopontin n=1 Tax=Esox lucius TaxID=8010 RepID=UPI0014774704|nr:osteopontin [Esox lucius]
MKAAIVFVLLFATVLCRPGKRLSSSSSESSEELVKPGSVLKKALEILSGVAPLQEVDPTLDPTTNSTASTDSTDSDESDESEESTDSTNSADSDDTDESSESEEPGTSSPTSEPTVEATLAPSTTPVFDGGRGDSIGHPGDYKKSIIYADTNNVEKGMSPYKSYGKTDNGMYAGKKVSVYNTGLGNEIEKTMTVFKALQVHDLMEEDTSTPEVESQGLDATSGTAGEPVLRQAHVDQASQDNSPSESLDEGDAESASAGEPTSNSSSSPSSNSSEETTGTPGAEDSDSTESQESDSDSAEEAITEAPVATDTPVVITAK